MRAFILVMAMCCAAGRSLAQDAEAEQRAKEIDAFCAKALCREARKVSLTREDGGTFEAAVPKLPIVLPNGWITLYPGEEIHIELAFANGAMKSARAVARPRRPADTVTFKLAQQPGKPDMTLSVSHGLSHTLKYSVGLMLPSGGGVFGTTSCPVRPALVTNEHWPHPVFQLVITNVRLLPEGASLNCER